MQFIDDLLTGIGLSQGVAQLLMTPVNLLAAAVLYCSFYPTYMSVFGNNYRQEIAANRNTLSHGSRRAGAGVREGA